MKYRENDCFSFYEAHSLIDRLLCEGNFAHALDFALRMISREPLEFSIKAAKAQLFLGDRKEAKQTLRKILPSIGKRKFCKVNNTRNKVWIIEDAYCDFFIKNAPLDELKAEEKLLDLYSEAGIQTPLPIGIETFNIGPSKVSCLITLREKGSTLETILSENINYNLLTKVVDSIHQIHSVKGIIDEQATIDPYEKFSNKINSVSLKLDTKIKKRLIQGFPSLLAAFVNLPVAYSKDAHPENIFVTQEKNIVHLDFEDRGKLPVTFDLANLLDYSNVLPYSSKSKFVERYYEQGPRTVSKEDFIIGYHASVIQRMVSLAEAWSHSGKEVLKKRRGELLERGIRAISSLKKKHTLYFRRFRQEYTHLTQALTLMKQQFNAENSKGF